MLLKNQEGICAAMEGKKLGISPHQKLILMAKNQHSRAQSNKELKEGWIPQTLCIQNDNEDQEDTLSNQYQRPPQWAHLHVHLCQIKFTEQ